MISFYHTHGCCKQTQGIRVFLFLLFKWIYFNVNVCKIWKPKVCVQILCGFFSHSNNKSEASSFSLPQKHWFLSHLIWYDVFQLQIFWTIHSSELNTIHYTRSYLKFKMNEKHLGSAIIKRINYLANDKKKHISLSILYLLYSNGISLIWISDSENSVLEKHE